MFLNEILFKNILRTFEAEILEVFKNIQPQPKNWTFLKTCSREFKQQNLQTDVNKLDMRTSTKRQVRHALFSRCTQNQQVFMKDY